MAKVYVVNKPSSYGGKKVYDISPASIYGEIVYLFSKDNDQMYPEITPDECLDVIHRLAYDITEEDYILWVGGTPVSLIMFISYLKDIGIQMLNMLAYSYKQDRYFAYKVDISRYDQIDSEDRG